ncbi:histidine kinase [Salinactinospora qingdaonensis]|uniref:histidine kinase n=1 Tax=Salinactinospora qingdaonensis TaxID=702744 RepID=A0ABP7FAV0_9ACTN
MPALALGYLIELARRPGGPQDWWPTRRAVLVDLLLWALLMALLLAQNVFEAVVHGRGGLAALPPAMLWQATILTGALLVSRAYPLVSLIATVGLVAVGTAIDTSIVLMFSLVGVRMRRLWPAVAVFVAVSCSEMLALWGSPASLNRWTDPILLLICMLLPLLVGGYLRQHQELLSAGRHWARQLERERHITAEQARLRERARIAQDMHDSLGHDLSLIALRAGALEVTPDLAAPHRAAAGQLREGATAATQRLRDITGVLRETSVPAPLEPAKEGVIDLVQRARASGMRIALLNDRAEADPPPMVERAIHRVVQEALTNATKHAPGATVTVRIARTAEATTVRVSNPAPPVAPAPDRPQGHSGLTGLAERVRLAGGTLRAEGKDGGFEVTAHFPTKGGAPETEEDDAHPPRPSIDAEAQWTRAKRRLRNRMIALVSVPVAALAVISCLVLSKSLYLAAISTLPESDYARLQVGMSKASAQEWLPQREYHGPQRQNPKSPGERRCAHYRATANPFPLRQEIRRLCFADGELVSKDTYTALGQDSG